MSFMTADLSNQIPTVMAMLMVISIVGIVGNVLVIIVYMLKHDKLTANLFILVLAVSDLLSCSTLVPATICIEYIEWRMQSVVFCKVYYLLNNTFIPFSSLLISCIAFDRYFCLCHPFLRIMTLSRARRVIFVLISVSFTIGCSSMFLVRLEKNDTSGNTTEKIYECTETTKVNHTTLENMVYQIVQKSQLVSHILCIISVIVLYVLIYRSVSKVSSDIFGVNVVPEHL
ncbi:uncharacterized protein DEA37_0011673 [Paragonimus westermani]|uniref:G-protein coupled receptors family 1 profile domain-containing protein n=1 Tax=Paragonimus westermani TaxID=34504 RepID=A0A5J4NU14_9TREM|nr:uncharacterized protein DEA37_0011673 [Paragonimus westermani]